MSRSWIVLALAVCACASAACSSASGTTGTEGTGGAGTGGASATGPGTGGAAACHDPTNPMFTSCIVPFIAGCWMPDLSGMCQSSNGTTTWADGYKYVTSGSMPGIYTPGQTTPCISLVVGQDSLTGTKGTQTLHFQSDPNGGPATITCPDGSTFTATNAQVNAFNTCNGFSCP